MQLRVVGKDTLNTTFVEFDPSGTTGEILLVRFGLPCISSRMGAARTREVDGWEEVSKLILTKSPIPHELLRLLFPQAVIDLGRYIENPLVESPWPFEKVLQFCREHQGKVGGCRSMEDVVRSVERQNKIIVMVQRDGKRCSLINLSSFPIQSGNRVYSHKGVIYHADL